MGTMKIYPSASLRTPVQASIVVFKRESIVSCQSQGSVELSRQQDGKACFRSKYGLMVVGLALARL